MEYPDNFETSAFPAGRHIAVSRFMAIGSLVVFVLIVFMCLVTVWAGASRRIHPFLISVDNTTGVWTLLGHNHGHKTMTAARTLQEATVGNFAQQWFSISASDVANNQLWHQCDRADSCAADTGAVRGRDCMLFCISDDMLFARFLRDIVPGYVARAAEGEQWVLLEETLDISPVGHVSENGGLWRVTGTLESNMYDGPLNIIAYAHVARNLRYYPRTLGFYVTEFNAYRLN